MAWICAVLFTAIGIWLIVKRRDAARGEGMMLGATMPIGCVVLQGIAFLLLAVGFLVMRSIGII